MANGHRYTNGLLHGTPRTDTADPRFDRSYVRADAFGPNAPAVWTVVERLTWFTYEDAQRLLRAAVQAQRECPLDQSVAYLLPYQLVAAARAAGEARLADWQALREIVYRIREMVRPPR